MTYRVAWTSPARRDMARLPGRVVTAVAVYVEDRLARDPHRRKPLSGALEGLRGARNGDYRVLFEIDDESRTIWIIHVDHRAHVYRPR